MSEFSATRNTCFALISAIEEDFRSLIEATSEALGGSKDLLPGDVREISLRRRAMDLRIDAMASSSVQIQDVDLLPYIDFADISKIIDARLAPTLESERDWLLQTSRSLVSLTPTRNRVCHTRPLEPEDLPNTLDFAEKLLAIRAPFQFPTLVAAMARLRTNPGFVLALQIPLFWTAGMSRTYNNLPLPEFDETGFLGRAGDRQNVARLLKSHYPVVTIVGEGGIGKTALALRCLYDLLDDSTNTYDAVVWVSMKTASLTQTGVRELTGAIKSTLGLLSEIVSQLGAPDATILTESELIDEIVQYLELYRVVVAIDNLETISTGALRALLERVPAHSKILLTSRVGVGEFEVRYPLQGLEEKTSISLLRTYSRILGVTEISRMDEGNIKGFCRRLFNNPLLLKWFVASVGRGADPGRLLSPEGSSFSNALAFCFENLFERFGEQEKTVIHCLASARKALSTAEIHFLTPALTDLDAEIALSALHNSSIVSRAKTEGHGLEYTLSESAVKFLNEKFPPTAEFFKSVQSRMRELRMILTNESKIKAIYDFNPFFVRVGSNRDEMISATYLRSALTAMRNNDLTTARQWASESKRLTPNSGEAWRIGALIEERAQEFYQASENFEQSIGLDPSSRIARYCYGMFLMSDMDDLEGALAQFNAAEKLEPGAAPVLTAKAMCLSRLGRLDEAAGIHEILLPAIKNRGRRWRLTGADQAADCYCRLAVRSFDMKEYEDGKIHSRRSLSILVEAAERSDLDNKIMLRVGKVICVALSRHEVISDLTFVEFVVSLAERIFDLSGAISIQLSLAPEWMLRNLQANDNYHARLMALDNSVENRRLLSANRPVSPDVGVDTASNERVLGAIFNVAEGGRYGFVINSAGERWFTHAQFMRDPEEWAHCVKGVSVSFRIGQNARGPCAVDVALLPRVKL